VTHISLKAFEVQLGDTRQSKMHLRCNLVTHKDTHASLRHASCDFVTHLNLVASEVQHHVALVVLALTPY